MKKIITQSSCKRLTAALAFVFIALTARAADPVFNIGDIAVINAIIENNGLKRPKALEDGSLVPPEWTNIIK